MPREQLVRLVGTRFWIRCWPDERKQPVFLEYAVKPRVYRIVRTWLLAEERMRMRQRARQRHER